MNSRPTEHGAVSKQTGSLAVDLPTEAATEALGQAIAGALAPSDTLLIQGRIGAGKTTLARAIIRALAGDRALAVASPTFLLDQIYETPDGPLHHFDLFRIRDPQECVEIGVEEALGAALVLIEWPERLGEFAPVRFLAVTMDIAEGEQRRAIFSHAGSRDSWARLEKAIAQW